MPKRKVGERMKLLTLHIPKETYQHIVRMVKMGYYPSISEYVRYALFQQMWRDHKLIEWVEKHMMGVGVK